MSLISMLIFLVLFFPSDDAKTIHLKKSPTKNNAIKLTNPKKLLDDQDGFYESTLSTVTPNGKFIVYDAGNKALHIYDKSGKHINSFGQEGSGPGEFQDGIFAISATNDRVYLKHFSKIMIFDFSGKLISEISDFFLPRSVQINLKDKIVFQFNVNEFSKMIKADYTFDGKLIKEYPNPKYDETALAKSQQGHFDSNQFKERFMRPRSLIPYQDGFIQHYAGSYKFDFTNKNLEITKTFIRDYDRVKLDPDFSIIPKASRDRIKSAPAEMQARIAQAENTAKGLMNGYKDDIVNPIGTKDGFLFIQTASDATHLKLDVINNDQLYSTIELEGDEILAATVEEGKLLVNYKNDDVGPYVIAYDIEIK